MKVECPHDDIGILQAHYYCEVCGVILEGDPDKDREEYILEMEAEEQLMELLGK